MRRTPRGRAALRVVGIVCCLAAATGVMFVMTDAAMAARTLSGAYWAVAGWLSDAAYPLLASVLLCLALAACLRIVAEALYCLVNDRRGVPYGIGMLAVALAASAGAAASVSAALSLGGEYGLAPLAVAVVVTLLALHRVSRGADIASLSVDATRHGMVPYLPYELASRRRFPLGILPSYRGMRRAVRRMQSVGTRHETILAIGSANDAARVARTLPAGSPLCSFLVGVVAGMPGNGVRYPFGIGRLIDADGGRFAIASAKKLAHATNVDVVSAGDFCDAMDRYSWLVRQTFVLRDATGTMPKADAPKPRSAQHEKGKVLPMSDGTSVILSPDQSGVIPIDQSTVVPIIKTDDTGDAGLIHADVSSLVDIGDDYKPRARHKLRSPKASSDGGQAAGKPKGDAGVTGASDGAKPQAGR